jgi:macrolide transport system ATP-binding/permease protein
MSRLIEIKGISKTYSLGTAKVHALCDASLTIDEGEFLAIMGASGSGKSTLLSILGFLDVSDGGSYLFQGRDVTRLGGDELSILRNNVAGFVFQQFQLLPRLTATDNVLLPTIYAGKHGMYDTARKKLTRVGLSHRLTHFPNELSGGEQQRVAIARSIVNDPLVIFADEPTGNLDTKSEEEIIRLLKELNTEGKTIVMVTHEQEIAAHASRIIRMKDGEIIGDERVKHGKKKTAIRKAETGRVEKALRMAAVSFGRAEFVDYVKQAGSSIVGHKMRSLLSMLGILIGVAAVISMLAIGQGANESITKSLSSLGTNLLTIRPGSFHQGGVALSAGSVTRFTFQDTAAIAGLDGIRRTSPTVNGAAQIVYGDKNANSQVMGVSTDYPDMRASVPVDGRFFTEAEFTSRAKVAIIGATVIRELFDDENPIGHIIKINRINFTVIGVLPAKGASMFRDQDDVIVVPATTAMFRLMGKVYVDSIDVEVVNPALIEESTAAINELIMKRHHLRPDQSDSFQIRDMSEIRNAMLSTSRTMSVLLGAVAAISLIVGGVGVMNIMLVSVKERTKEIGLRKAIGARRRDILVQFLVEAVMMTFTGGISGILLGILTSTIVSKVAGWAVKISPAAVVGATLFSVLVGIGFGIWPAIQASRLHPIEALRYE